MPIKGNKTLEEQIPDGEHLTFTDKMRAGFTPSTGEDEVGNKINPREQFLRRQAQMRAAEARRNKGK